MFSRNMIIFFMINFTFLLFSYSINLNALEGNNEKMYSNATLNDEFADDSVLVVLNENASSKSIKYDKSDFPTLNCIDVVELTTDTQKNGEYKKVLCLQLGYSSKEYVLEVIDELMKREDVYYAGPDYELAMTSITPNDYDSVNEWAIENIDLLNAWNITTGTNEVKVGVIDSGIDGSHPELVDSIDISLCRDFSDGTIKEVTNSIDPVGHGTMAAGIIAAKSNNGQGIAGVNWNVRLISLRVFNLFGQGNTSYVAKAIQYAEENSIPILNLSAAWYSDQTNIGYDIALNEVINNYSGLFICSAGNNGKNNDEFHIYPSCEGANNIISVGAHDKDNRRSIWSETKSSNYGKECVDIFAPGGSGLENNNKNCYTTAKNSSYSYFWGTSCSSPFVAGVASLILSKYPYLSPTAIKEIIMNGVEKVYDDQGNSVFEDLCVSGGKLNAYQSLNSYKEITINEETEVVNNLNEGKGLFGFYTDKSQFIKITMNAVLQSGNLTYPEGSFRLLNSKGEVVKKYEMSEFTDNAVNKEGYNTLNVFLPELDYYYIDVDYNANNLCSLKLKVENIDMYNMQIDLFDYSDYYELDLYLINNVNTVDYLKELTINQAAKYNFKITTNGSYRLVVLKRNELGLFSELTVYKNEEYVGNQDIEIGLPHGTYYIGYFDLTNNSTFTLSMHRIVNQNNGVTLLPDPLQSINCGSQINVVEKDINYAYRSYGENTILEGFTRIIYLSNWTSRTDYYWYSSNEDVAMVTDFGTVLAKDVSQNTEIKIMAVNKYNPSVVYIKEFVILNDNENYNSSPIDINISMMVSVSTLTSINFGNVQVPYNFLQYYNWESSNSDYAIVDSFGRVYAYRDGIGELVTITGVYIYNPRVKININLNIVE